MEVAVYNSRTREKIIFDNIEKAANYIIDEEIEELYNDMLDEIYGEIDICGYSYAASIAFYGVDRIAYNCGMSDYSDGLLTELIDEIERNDYTSIYGYDIEVKYEEEGDDEE